MQLILTLHTTTDWNEQPKRMQGQKDIPLNEKGREEARELAEKLKSYAIDKIVSSDLSRARQTAEIINEKHNIPLVIEARLRECSFGVIEGLTKQQALEKYGEALRVDWEDQYEKYDFHLYKGESRDEVLKRHLAVVQQLAQNPTPNATLLVGHSRGFETLLAGLGLSPDLKRGEFLVITQPM